MRKNELYIGSSLEELSLAVSVENFKSLNFEVTIWNDTVWDTALFKINKISFTIYSKQLQYDFVFYFVPLMTKNS